MDPDPASFLLLLSSLMASAFFSGMEIAYVSANRLQAELDRKQGGLAGRLVEFLMRRPEQFIATMLVGNNLALVVFGLESGALLSQWIFGVSTWELAPSPLLALAVQTAMATVVILITAEFLPKSFSMARRICGSESCPFPLSSSTPSCCHRPWSSLPSVVCSSDESRRMGRTTASAPSTSTTSFGASTSASTERRKKLPWTMSCRFCKCPRLLLAQGPRLSRAKERDRGPRCWSGIG